MNTLKSKFVFLFTLLYLFSSTIAPVFANITYPYDTNGNMSSDGTNCYSYNDANQLTQVTNCSSGKLVEGNIYDYQGNRIAKKSYDANGNLTKTTYTPTKGYETVRLASNSAVQNTAYYYINDKLVARKNPDMSKSYYLSDNLNSTNVLTDQSGNVIENSSYYPFGDIRTGGTKSKQLYTGQINDPETGLDYYNARYYNSHIRRFTQPDDVVTNVYDTQGLNRYSYVNNNPLTYNDPSGHCIEDLCITEATLYLTAISSSPDLPRDTQNLAEATADFTTTPDIGTGIAVALSAVAIALPDISGPSPKAVESATNGVFKGIGSTGKYGEQELAKIVEGNKQFFPMQGFKGGRIVDIYKNTNR